MSDVLFSAPGPSLEYQTGGVDADIDNGRSRFVRIFGSDSVLGLGPRYVAKQPGSRRNASEIDLCILGNSIKADETILQRKWLATREMEAAQYH